MGRNTSRDHSHSRACGGTLHWANTSQGSHAVLPTPAPLSCYYSNRTPANEARADPEQPQQEVTSLSFPSCFQNVAQGPCGRQRDEPPSRPVSRAAPALTTGPPPEPDRTRRRRGIREAVHQGARVPLAPKSERALTLPKASAGGFARGSLVRQLLRLDARGPSEMGGWGGAARGR